jgi:hypothetical protein
MREVEERGTRMPFPAAVKLALIVETAAQDEPSEPGPGKFFSARE